MKKLILFSMLLAAWVGTARIWAEVDPGDQFLDAYLLVQDGDVAERETEWAKANAKYTAALSILSEISTNSPDWNPHIIEFRTKYCADHLNALKSKLPAPAPAPETPAPVPTPTPVPMPVISAPPVVPRPAPAETERIQQLTAELQRAQNKIREVETARTDLKAKLDEALAKPVPVVAAPDARVTELTKQNQELSTQLATTQAQMADLKEKLQAAAKPAAPVAPAESEELKQLGAELQRAKDELVASGKKLDGLLNEKSALDQRYESVSAQLAAAEQELRTAKPGAERDELVVVKKQLEQSQQRLTVAQEAVEAARAEAKRAQRTADEVTAKLSETERQLRAAKTASAKNEEIIQQLRRENADLKRERDQNLSARQAEEEYTGPTIPELKGWRAHNWPPNGAQPKPAAPTAPATAASKQEKVTATIPAPPKPAPEKKTVAPVPARPAKPAPVDEWGSWYDDEVAPVPAKPVKPAPAQDSGWWPFGKKQAAVVMNQPPAVKAPGKVATD